jgi:hypothetical protein
VAGALTTHTLLALRLKKEVELSSTPPFPSLQGLLQDECYLLPFPHEHVCSLHTLINPEMNSGQLRFK